MEAIETGLLDVFAMSVRRLSPEGNGAFKHKTTDMDRISEFSVVLASRR